MSGKLQTEIILRGSNVFQNKLCHFPTSEGRSLTATWFKRHLANANVVNRSWLVFSPHKASVYCFCCLLFYNKNCKSSFSLQNGFARWKHIEKVSDHEKTLVHRQLFTVWKETERRLTQGTGIDNEIEKQILSEKNRWRELLKRLLSCIKFLAYQNLALRGHEENLNSDKSQSLGNFLSLLQLIAEYDPLLASHLEYCRSNPGKTSYLSPNIQNEFISLLAQKVRNTLLENIRKSKYYGLIFDSTPDAQHREQLSEIIRYMEIDLENNNVEIKESFLGYLELKAKDAEALETVLIETLQVDNLPIADCRSQCYDNAAVMTGHISGLQQRVCKLNHRAVFINCDNHSLNLAGLHSAQEDPVMLTFFATVERIYSFFVRSTMCWQKLNDSIPFSIKRESTTRWSSRAEAVKAIYVGEEQIIEILEELSDDSNQRSDTRSDAQSLLQCILNFNFLVLLHFWNIVLEKMDRVQKRLQDPNMNFRDAALDLDGLHRTLLKNREEICFASIENGKAKCSEYDVSIEKRICRIKKRYGEKADDCGLTTEQEIERVIKGALDRGCQEISSRFPRLNRLNNTFGLCLMVKVFWVTKYLKNCKRIA